MLPHIGVEYNKTPGSWALPQYIGPGEWIPFRQSTFIKKFENIILEPVTGRFVERPIEQAIKHPNLGKLPSGQHGDWRTFWHDDLKVAVKRMPDEYFKDILNLGKENVIDLIEEGYVMANPQIGFGSNNATYEIIVTDPNTELQYKILDNYSYDFNGRAMHEEIINYASEYYGTLSLEERNKNIDNILFTIRGNTTIIGASGIQSAITNTVTNWESAESFRNFLTKFNEISNNNGLSTIDVGDNELEILRGYFKKYENNNKFKAFLLSPPPLIATQTNR